MTWPFVLVYAIFYIMATYLGYIAGKNTSKRRKARRHARYVERVSKLGIWYRADATKADPIQIAEMEEDLFGEARSDTSDLHDADGRRFYWIKRGRAGTPDQDF